MTTKRISVYLSLAAFALACTPSVEQATPPRISIDSGILEGAYVAGDSETAVFKGIPYARAPMGDLRWKPPQPAEPWEGIRPATELGPACPQPDFLSVYFKGIDRAFGLDDPDAWGLGETSENCLYLNVYTANLGSEQKRPVMLWIHGGANYLGSASDFYDGGYLAEKDAVVVTINYRLGVLGFLAHPDLTAESSHHSSGNYAMLDQIQALEWVQNNISAFGGDPERVTIFGESAGGTDVGLLIASPLSDGLFHRAIVQSNHAVLDTFKTLEAAEALGHRLAVELCAVEGKEGLAALRRMSADEMISAVHKERSMPYGPIVDGWILPESPASKYMNGRQLDVPLLIGSNADEGTLLSFPPSGVEEYNQWARDTFGSFAARILELYPVTKPDDVPHAHSRWTTDFTFGASAKCLAGSMGRVSSKAYLYHFTRVPPGPGGEKIGAFHVSEISFIFNMHPEKWPKHPYDDALTETMSSYWVQFAATSDPNRDGLPHWPAYDRSTDQHLELGEEVKVESGLQREATDLFTEILEARIKHGT